jgi:predicted CXXCH cytochrome family protein
MKKRGLQQKIKLQVLVLLVVFLHLFGYEHKVFITHVNGEVPTGKEPRITIISPISGDFSKESNITISGKVENVPIEVPIVLYDGLEPIGTISEVIENSWAIPVILSEGAHTISAKAEIDGNQITSNIIDLNIDFTLPTVQVINLKNGKFLNSRVLEGSTEALSNVEICMDCTGDFEEEVVGTWSTVQADETGNWEYNIPQLTEGNHTIHSKATDRAGNNGNVKRMTIILDSLRPTVSSEVFPKQDMTRIPLNSTIKVKISDASTIDEAVIENSLHLSRDGVNIKGIISYNSSTMEITFTPNEPLLPSTKYNVFISPLGIIDSAGNNAFPRFWSFTTVNDTTLAHENPHGSYTNNVNTCGNCHNTHQAKDSNLLSTKTEDSELDENLTVDNYCMACHDGTVAPLPENRLDTHTHNAAVKINGKPSGSSCSSCHNPHLNWSEKNPNLAQDHIKYKHLPSIPVDPKKPTEEISSKEQLCESCHENNSAEKIANPAVVYRVFQYNKSSTATGIYEDYDLCLRCHNGDFKKKYNKTADIATYYNNLTEEVKQQYEIINGQLSFTKREITSEEKEFSSHFIKARDGSPLAGNFPCAECHDTHGSNNIKQLKEQLGHEQLGTENKQNFQAKTGEWDALKERAFCLTCHNGETGLFGITVKALPPLPKDSSGNDQTGHNSTSQESCASCHTDSYKKDDRGFDLEAFRESAHAPKKIPKK